MTLKQKTYSRFLELLNDKILLLQKTMSDLKESASNETKSTAGDKHETALAMLQIEQENTNRQLKEAAMQKAVFEKIDPTAKAPYVTTGSLVKTNRGCFFISIALGKTTVNDTTVIAISPQSPLGLKLKGLHINEATEINGITYVISGIE